ncbi:hypothetical protein RND71_012569 [Anisodus tanguticus]|uniref:Uncharacterized protein n=1 Tax=Anisodus tanguticus TaxID=243964 RepID=A0AAE1SG06_9SOLA|nr:hypothetical protein RND71_012569 [Anisodus tanguticus]
MMLFLAKAVNSPGFLAQFVQQQNDNNKRMMEDNKKRRIRQYIPSDDHSDGGSNTWNSGVTLQEVPPASAQPFSSATSAVVGQSSLSANIQFSESSSLVGAQDLPLVSLSLSDIIMPEPSQLQEIMPENNMDINGSETGNGSFMDPMLGVNGKFPLELDTFSPDLQIEWKSALMDDDIGELPSVGGPFWEKFLQSPFPTETEEMDSVEIEDIKMTETKPLENRWDKVQNMEHLTEQMELLTSNSKKSMIGHQRKCT